METYIILTKLSAEAFDDPSEFPALAQQVADKIKAECPEVVWKASFALMGRFDVLDIIEAPSREVAELAAMVIRAYGHGTTETMAATPWKQFIESLELHREAVGALR
jgi:uncharacterized protein with GYD domain